MTRFALALIGLLLVAPFGTTSAQAPGTAALRKGDALFHNGDFENARQLYAEAAQAGNSIAKMKLDGMSYVQPGEKIAADVMNKVLSMGGFKGGKDLCTAASLYAEAAAAGNSVAAVRLGQILEQWTNLPCTPPAVPGQPSPTLGKAMQWFIAGARAGNTEAMQELATIYLSGIGVPKDKVEGRRWLELAADRGSMEAETKLQQLDKVTR